VPPVPAREPTQVELLSRVRSAARSDLRLVRHPPSGRIEVLQQVRHTGHGGGRRAGALYFPGVLHPETPR
jgi:hypothetical protein